MAVKLQRVQLDQFLYRYIFFIKNLVHSPFKLKIELKDDRLTRKSLAVRRPNTASINEFLTLVLFTFNKSERILLMVFVEQL